MVQSIGICMILAVTTLTGAYFCLREKYRLQDLRELERAMVMMESQIRFLSVPLSEVLENISYQTKGQVGMLMQETAKAMAEKNSVGGVVECVVHHIPAGVGGHRHLGFPKILVHIASFLQIWNCVICKKVRSPICSRVKAQPVGQLHCDEPRAFIFSVEQGWSAIPEAVSVPVCLFHGPCNVQLLHALALDMDAGKPGRIRYSAIGPVPAPTNGVTGTAKMLHKLPFTIGPLLLRFCAHICLLPLYGLRRVTIQKTCKALCRKEFRKCGQLWSGFSKG